MSRTSEKNSERLWTGTFVLILAATFCVFMMGQGINSSTSVFIERQGGSTAFSGILALIFSLSAAAMRLAAGPMVDRIGRRPVLVGGLAVFVVGVLGPALNSSIAAFVVWRILQGVGFSMATTSASTAAADVLPMERLGEGIGYHGLGQALAMSVGPAFGLWLVGTDPASNVFFGIAIVGVVGFVLALLCTYEKHIDRLPRTSAYYQRMEMQRAEQREASLEEDGRGSAVASDRVSAGPAAADADGFATEAGAPAADTATSRETAAENRAAGKDPWWRSVVEPGAIPGVLPLFLLTPLFGFSIYFCGLYGTVVGVGSAGLYFTLSAVTMILVRLAGKSFMDKRGPLLVHGAAVLCGIGCVAMLLAAQSFPSLFYVAGPFYGVCMGLGMPVGQSVSVKNSPASRWGAANALYQLSGDVGIGMSAVLWGVLNDALGFSSSLVCCLVCAVLSFVLAYLFYPGHGLHPLEARGLE